MNAGILLLTHGNLGAVLLQSATDVLGVCPLRARTLAAPPGCDTDQVLAEARAAAAELDEGDGVLVLTDLFGATPSNIACRLREHLNVRVVAGVNLPMLIRVLNYPRLSLDELADKAISGGRDGILPCPPRGA